ncbi:unnamed protein product [Haemonchus placei]|uniref:Uncharacterized protein n=1 Tax=Haemonchus placei TaxID=6290 RepID=A0A0N4WG83_HAEPC|nr:unnamed protein product [Haemonchus placei]
MCSPLQLTFVTIVSGHELRDCLGRVFAPFLQSFEATPEKFIPGNKEIPSRIPQWSVTAASVGTRQDVLKLSAKLKTTWQVE